MKTTSTFKVYLKRSLTSEEFNLLHLFYLPILGFDAFGIYSIFYNFAKAKLNDSNKHVWFFDSYGFTLKKFLSCRKKLEGLELIETYVDDDNYIYILKPPLTREKFLQKPFFGKLLESKIGDDNLIRLNKLAKNNFNLSKNYKLINKNFEESYQFSGSPILDDMLLDVLINNEKVKVEKTDEIILFPDEGLLSNKNYNFFIDKIGGLANTSLLNQEIKEEIIRQAGIYEYNVEDFVEIIKKVSLGKTNIEPKHIKQAAKRYYEDTYEANSRNKDNGEINLKDELEAIKKLSIMQIIDKRIKNIDERQKALNTIDEFWKKNEIIDENIIKIFIIYILREKDGILPHVNYLKKVYETWNDEGISSALDALKHINGLKNNKKAIKKKKNIPEWHEEVLKKLDEWD